MTPQFFVTFLSMAVIAPQSTTARRKKRNSAERKRTTAKRLSGGDPAAYTKDYR
jgi:hypothetical protein